MIDYSAKSGYRMLFEDIRIGRKFERNGNLWIKKSTRTASIIYPAEYSGRWFYFKNHDLVTIGIDVAELNLVWRKPYNVPVDTSINDEIFQANAEIQKHVSKILTDEA